MIVLLGLGNQELAFRAYDPPCRKRYNRLSTGTVFFKSSIYPGVIQASIFQPIFEYIKNILDTSKCHKQLLRLPGVNMCG